MKLLIYNENYMLGGDSNSFKLYKKVAKRDALSEIIDEDSEAEAGWTIICYPTSIYNAYKRIVDIESRNTAATTWEGYFKHLNKIHEILEKDITMLSELSVVDHLLTNTMKVPSSVIALGDDPVPADKPKRGRKKKTEV